MEIYAFFEWLDTSLLADVSKAYGRRVVERGEAGVWSLVKQ